MLVILQKNHVKFNLVVFQTSQVKLMYKIYQHLFLLVHEIIINGTWILFPLAYQIAALNFEILYRPWVSR